MNFTGEMLKKRNQVGDYGNVGKDSVVAERSE